jgi:hypothetical protein
MRLFPSLCLAIVATSAAPGLALAQRPPPIVTDFDGEDERETEGERETGGEREAVGEGEPAAPPTQPSPPGEGSDETAEGDVSASGRLRSGTGASRLRPPPIVTDFDGDYGLYGEDEDEPVPDDVYGSLDESPEEARRRLRAELLEERQRALASRRAELPGARLLASPFLPSSAASAPGGARGRLPLAVDRLELGLASANVPVTSIGVHDDGMRARVGVALDAFREEVGFRVRFEPMVALYNDGTFGLPSEYVRIAFAASATYRTPLPDLPLAFFAGVAFEHESDYSTLRRVNFAYTNVLAVRAGLLWDAGPLHGLLRLAARTHLYSRTNVAERGDGSATGELAADLVVRSGSPESVTGNIQLCGALGASWVAPSDEAVIEEAHLDLLLGACARDPVLGELSLSVELNLGNKQGWDRSRQTEHVGAVLRWSI